MYTEIRNVAPSVHKRQVIFRISVITILAFLISYSIGSLVIPLASSKLAEESTALNRIYITRDEEKEIEKINGLILDYSEKAYDLQKISNQFNSFIDFQAFQFKNKISGTILRLMYNSTEYATLEFIPDSIAKKMISEQLSQRLTALNAFSDQNTKIKRLCEYYRNIQNNISARKSPIYDEILQDSSLITLDIITNSIEKDIMNQLADYEHSIDSLTLAKLNLTDPVLLRNKFNNDKKLVLDLSEQPIWRTVNAVTGKKMSLKTIPNMHMFRAIIALFIGIFINLIIHEKSITEPI